METLEILNITKTHHNSTPRKFLSQKDVVDPNFHSCLYVLGFAGKAMPSATLSSNRHRRLQAAGSENSPGTGAGGDSAVTHRNPRTATQPHFCPSLLWAALTWLSHACSCRSLRGSEGTDSAGNRLPTSHSQTRPRAVSRALPQTLAMPGRTAQAAAGLLVFPALGTAGQLWSGQEDLGTWGPAALQRDP